MKPFRHVRYCDLMVGDVLVARTGDTVFHVVEHQILDDGMVHIATADEPGQPAAVAFKVNAFSRARKAVTVLADMTVVCPAAPLGRAWDTPRHAPTRRVETDPAFPRPNTVIDVCIHCAAPITAHRDEQGLLSLWSA